MINGRKRNFWLDINGKLRDIERTTALPGDGKVMADKLVKKGAVVLSEKEVETIKQKRREERANTPDYETGNPFHERGKGKLVYRPRRRRK